MQVAFEKESHHFWTVSKDKMVKYWDGDRVGDVSYLFPDSINAARVCVC